MASKCEVCGKGPSWGMSVSHSHRRTKRRWNPNIQRVRASSTARPSASTSAPAASSPARSSRPAERSPTCRASSRHTTRPPVTASSCATPISTTTNWPPMRWSVRSSACCARASVWSSTSTMPAGRRRLRLGSEVDMGTPGADTTPARTRRIAAADRPDRCVLAIRYRFWRCDLSALEMEATVHGRMTLSNHPLERPTNADTTELNEESPDERNDHATSVCKDWVAEWAAIMQPADIYWCDGIRRRVRTPVPASSSTPAPSPSSTRPSGPTATGRTPTLATSPASRTARSSAAATE